VCLEYIIPAQTQGAAPLPPQAVSKLGATQGENLVLKFGHAYIFSPYVTGDF